MDNGNTGTLKVNLTAIFGLGKIFRNKETTVIEAGTEITSSYNKDGYTFFYAKELGRSHLYAVENESDLVNALGQFGYTYLDIVTDPESLDDIGREYYRAMICFVCWTKYKLMPTHTYKSVTHTECKTNLSGFDIRALEEEVFARCCAGQAIVYPNLKKKS